MPLTFQAAQTALASRAPSGQLGTYINRAVERLLVIGGVKGVTEKVTFTVTGDVTPANAPMPEIPAETLMLPAKYSTILGCIVRGAQTGVAAEWYAYQPGIPIDSAGLPVHPISDLGISLTTGLRSYHVPLFEGDSSVTVVARCRIQHVELSANGDLVPITNLSALGLAVDAIGYEMAGDFPAATNYFARAANILREERKELETEVPASSPVRIIHLGDSPSGDSSIM
jgi:hypothetical protein